MGLCCPSVHESDWLIFVAGGLKTGKQPELSERLFATAFLLTLSRLNHGIAAPSGFLVDIGDMTKVVLLFEGSPKRPDE